MGFMNQLMTGGPHIGFRVSPWIVRIYVSYPKARGRITDLWVFPKMRAPPFLKQNP